jgi:hypothetical protein
MANLILEVPDELVKSLEGIAATQRVSVQQLALERLSSLVAGHPEHQAGSAAALLRVMRELPQVSFDDVAELDAAILAGRQPIPKRDLF